MPCCLQEQKTPLGRPPCQGVHWYKFTVRTILWRKLHREHLRRKEKERGRRGGRRRDGTAHISTHAWSFHDWSCCYVTVKYTYPHSCMVKICGDLFLEVKHCLIHTYQEVAWSLVGDQSLTSFPVRARVAEFMSLFFHLLARWMWLSGTVVKEREIERERGGGERGEEREWELKRTGRGGGREGGRGRQSHFSKYLDCMSYFLMLSVSLISVCCCSNIPSWCGCSDFLPSFFSPLQAFL